MTISDNVVSLQRCLIINNNNKSKITITTKNKREMKSTANEKLTIIKIGDFDYNYMNKEGINEWFKFVGYFIKDGFAKVQRDDGLWNLITKEGKILSEEWFMWLDDFKDGVARVQRTNGEQAKIDKTGKIVSK